MHHHEKHTKTAYTRLANLVKAIGEPFFFRVPLKKKKAVKPNENITFLCTTPSGTLISDNFTSESKVATLATQLAESISN